MRRLISAIWIILFLMCLLVPASAHPGRTDGSGGHTNRSTGEYHYHHGYPAHDHYDMDGDGVVDCRYDFKNTEERNNSQGVTKKGETTVDSKTKRSPDFVSIVEKIAQIIIIIGFGSLFFGQLIVMFSEDIATKLFGVGFFMFIISIPFGLLILIFAIFK